MRGKAAPLSTVDRLRQLERGELPSCGADDPRIALVYPNSYAVGMSSLGFQSTLYQMRRNGLDAERFFALEPPLSFDSGAPLHAFDVIAFSIAFELDWLHLLQFLEQARIPIRASERKSHHPLVIAGGVCVTMNRAPAWPFVDIFLHGESEALIPQLAPLLRRRDLTRSELVEQMARMGGVEVTTGCLEAHGIVADQKDGDVQHNQTPPPPEPLLLSDLDSASCMTRIFSPETEFANMGLISIARGCPNFCTFCWIGHNAPEYRVVSAERVLEWAEWQMRYTDRLGLVASAVGAHPQIDEICQELVRRGAKISYSSLRVEEVTPTMLEAIAASGQKSITLAPEAGSLRVRRLLGKNIADEQFLQVIDWALERGMLSIKLYFMTGIPTESEDEADAIINFVERVRERLVKAGKSSGQIGAINVNLGLFVPKPNLPLLNVQDELTFQQKSARLKRLVKSLSRIPNTRVAAASPDLSYAQGILSMESGRASAFLEEVLRAQGNWRTVTARYRKDAS